MAQLEDFTSDSPVTLEELAPVKDDIVVNNPPSNKNLAAFTAGIGAPAQLENHFRNVISETEVENTSDTAEDVIGQAQQENLIGSNKALSDYLSLADIPIEVKQLAVDGFEAQVTENNKTQNLFAQKMAMQDSPGETQEADVVRTLSSQAWERANAFNQTMQGILNAEETKFDPSLAEDTISLLEVMAPFAESANFSALVDELRGGEGKSTPSEVFFAGSTRGEIRDIFQNMELEDRLVFTENLIGLVNKHSSIVLSDSNRFAQMEYLRSVLEAGYYDEEDEWIDNAFSMLDHTVIGGLATAVLRGVGKGFKLLGSAGKARRVRSGVQPSTPSQTLKEVNPDAARDVFEASSLNDEVAQAAYGTNSAEVVGNDLLPEVGAITRNKVGNINSKGDGPGLKDPNLQDFVTNNDGAIYLTVAEKRASTQNIVNDYRNANGMTNRDEMMNVTVDGNDLNIRSVYGAEEGGFLDPQDAVDSALFNLRDMGVVREDLVLLKNVEGNRVAVDTNTTEVGDYLISVNSHHKLSQNVTEYDSLDVKNNFLDRFGRSGGEHGTFQTHLVDAHSAIHPNITLGANVQVDKAVGLESILSKSTEIFQTGYAKLPKERKFALNSFIKDANDRGLDFNPNTMRAAGLSNGEMNLMSNWREFWDAQYWLENQDAIKTLRSRGFKAFDSHGEKHFARPRAVGNFQQSTNVLDPKTNKIVHMSRNEIKTVYDNGGTLAELRRPLVSGNDKADFLMSTEQKAGPFLRGINDGDEVITYRKGYYQVHYKEPVFIDKIVRNAKGEVLSQRAVSTAGNIKDGEHEARRLASTDPDGHEYIARPDNKKMRADSDDAWDLQVSAGRTAQRHRGDRLEHAAGVIQPNSANILDPMESLVKSIRSVSKRVAMRDIMDSTKSRFLQQYAGVLPKDKFGQPKFPTNRSEIGGGKFATGEVADARTMFEYLRYLEDGYTNAIDDIYKATMSGMADTLGRFTSTGEKIFRGLESANPTHLAKSASFKLYLAANPLRQWIVQGHQAVRLTTLFPAYVTSGKMTSQMMVMSAHMRGLKIPSPVMKTTGWTHGELNQLVKEWKASGLPQAVDSNNLVRGDLKQLADVTIGQKAKSVLDSPFKFGQRVGFDTGEDLNIKSAWLAYRNQAKNAGKKFTSDVRDEVAANARNITYNMNAAGDLPYNQNFLNVAMQFMQVPHKALMQNIGNRALSNTEKVKLITQDAILWGIPAGTIVAIFGEVLPEDPDLRRALESGLEDVMLNTIIETTLGEETDINFSDSLSPGNLQGMGEVIHEIMTGNIGEGIANSPAGQLLFGGNPRLTNMANTAARYFNFVDDYQDPTEFAQVTQSVSQLMSGMSNFWKAKYALKAGQKQNSLYDTSDYQVTSGEAMAQLFGFRTWDEVQKQAVKKELYDKEFLEDDIGNWYREFKVHMGRKGITDQQTQFVQRVFNEALRVWGPYDMEAKAQINKLIARDLQNNDDVLFKSIMRQSGVMDNDQLLRLAQDSGLEDEQREILVRAIEQFQSYRSPN